MKRILNLGAIIVGLIGFNHCSSAADPEALKIEKTETIDPVTGQKRAVMEKYTRDGNNVISIIHLYKDGKLTASSRFTYAFGRKILQEGDEDADGFYELRIITPSDDPNSVEVFQVERNGTIKPASAAKLKEYREYALKQEKLGEFMRGEIEKVKGEQSGK